MRATTLTGLFILIIVTAAGAFEVKELAPQAFLKWNTSAPVSISLNSAGSADLPNASVQSAVQQALNAWQTVPGQTLRFQLTGTSSTAAYNTSDMQNSIVWMESGWPYGAEVLAMTRYSYYADGAPAYADADILMNGQHYKWSTSNTANSATVSVKQVLLHELGHLVGLSHSSFVNAVMYPSLSAQPRFVLTPDDKTGLQYLYGDVGTGFSLQTPVPNAVYVENMSSKGLPLPVLRWRAVPGANYTVEFSDSASFTKKYRLTSGSRNSLPLTTTHEAQLRAMAPDGSIFWRVVAGSQRTPNRQLRFRKAS